MTATDLFGLRTNNTSKILRICVEVFFNIVDDLDKLSCSSRTILFEHLNPTHQNGPVHFSQSHIREVLVNIHPTSVSDLVHSPTTLHVILCSLAPFYLHLPPPRNQHYHDSTQESSAKAIRLTNYVRQSLTLHISAQ